MIAETESKVYHWEKWSGKIPDDAIFTSKRHIVARTKIDDNWQMANYDVSTSKCVSRYGKTEWSDIKDFEIFVAEPDAVVEWVSGFLGAYPIGGVPIGSRGLYVGRNIWSDDWILFPASIDPQSHEATVICTDGWHAPPEYEALVIRDASDLKASECTSPFAWCKWYGLAFDNAVPVSERYGVGRVNLSGVRGLNTYGKLDLKNNRFTLIWNDKIQSYAPGKVEVLVHSKDGIVEWVPYDLTNNPPLGAIGYHYSGGRKYVGRIKSEVTNNEYIPAEIDKKAENCTYIFDKKIMKDTKCEILTITIPTNAKAC